MARYNKPGKGPKTLTGPSVKDTHEGLLTFSLKYLNIASEKFPVAADANYLRVFVERLKDVSTMKATVFASNYSKSLRNHAVDFASDRVSEDSFGLPNEDQLVDTPMQFSLSQGEYGRVVGFMIRDTFYVVWLDPNHELYPGDD